MALTLIAGVGLGAMVFAYRGRGSVAVVFPELATAAAETSASSLNPEAAIQFQQGCAAYQQGKFREAIRQFSQAIQLDPELAAAYHNRGRAVANLRRITEAVADLVKASELYLQQNHPTEFNQLKQDLALLKEQQ